MRKLGVGIVGCGEIAVAHAKAIENSGNARIVMTMDVVEEVAKDLAERHGAEGWTTNLDELLENPKVEAVYIATPHHLHAPLTVKAAEVGKHVMVEKPIATKVEDAKGMIEACRRNGVKLSVCFILRYHPVVRKAREIVRGGLIGKVMGVEMVAMGDKPESYWTGGYTGRVKTDWRTSKEKSGGGILIMNASHNIDYMRFITGLEAERVYAESDTFATPVEVEDFIGVVVRYKGGAIGTIRASSCARGGPGPVPFVERIFGTEGQVVLDLWKRRVWLWTAGDTPLSKAKEWTEVEIEPSEDPRALYVREFASSVLEDKEPPVTGEDGLRALEVVSAAYEAAESGRPVAIGD